MSITMYDAIYVQNLEPPPPGAQAYAGYVNGNWPDYAGIKAQYPQAPVLSIAVTTAADAECLDVENGDATIAQIYGWFKRQKSWRPVIYSSADNISHIYATMTANGFGRSSYRLWSAHYGAGQHICGPASCRLADIACDGTQWANYAQYDESILNDDFFGAPVSKGPFRHVVPNGNAWTLEGLARDRGTTVAALTALARANLDAKNLAVFEAYITLDDACALAGINRPALPGGTVYYTSNP